VYANATADLRPVTPLGDARIELRPGRPPAPELDNGALINLAATSAPVHLSDLLSRLDADTRGYLAGLLGSLERGTHDAGPDLRRMLLSLAPTTAQLRGISHALAQRRTELSTFVHNLSRLTHAASRDGRLASVVAAGNQTLEALAEQEQPLRESLAQLPATLTVAESTLSKLRPYATKLGPTLSSLEPALNRLPDTIDGLGRFSRTSAEVLRDDVTPLVSRAQPLLREANPAVSNLTESTPALTTAAQTLNYFLNELAFVPGADNQGFLFWLAWAAHNLNSGASTGDANGSLLRGAVLVDCHGLQSYPLLSDVFPKLGVCPQ
jgi:phospholipid/cholesterol/gamma-HCH transport system substrate-binding protein